MKSPIAWDSPLYTIQSSLWKSVQKHADRLEGRLLDIGCGQQPYRSLLTRVTNYVGLDLPKGQAPGVTVDVYGSAMTLPFADNSFDSLISSEVLEHLPEPGQALTEAARVSRPGAWLLLTVPWLWPVHAAPHDFYRYTPFGLRYLLEKSGFRVESIEKTGGLVAAAGQRLAGGLAYGLGTENRPLLRKPGRLAGAGIQRGAIWLDRHLGHPGESLNYVVMAQKQPD